MRPSAPARVAAEPVPLSAAIVFPVDAATRTNSRYPCISSAMLLPPWSASLLDEPVLTAGLCYLLQQPVTSLLLTAIKITAIYKDNR